MGLLRKKISDRRFLRLIEVLRTAPVLEDGKSHSNDIGCPQSSILSPILANIYLHHVIDEWFAEISRSHIRGKADMVRYADDMVFTFEYQHEAKRFYSALPEKAGLVWPRTSRRQIAAYGCGSRGGDEGKSEERTPSNVQLSGGYLLLGQNAQRVLAAEVYQPERPFCGQAERPERLPVEEPERQQKANPEHGYPGSAWMD